MTRKILNFRLLVELLHPKSTVNCWRFIFFTTNCKLDSNLFCCKVGVSNDVRSCYLCRIFKMCHCHEIIHILLFFFSCRNDAKFLWKRIPATVKSVSILFLWKMFSARKHLWSKVLLKNFLIIFLRNKCHFIF